MPASFTLSSCPDIKLGCQGNHQHCIHPHTHTYIFTLSHTHSAAQSASKLQLFTYLLCAYGNEMANKRRKRKEKLRWLTEMYINDANTHTQITLTHTHTHTAMYTLPFTHALRHWLRLGFPRSQFISVRGEKQQFLESDSGFGLSWASSTGACQFPQVELHLIACHINLYLPYYISYIYICLFTLIMF